MKRSEAQFASPAALEAARHLGALLRQGRLARQWTLAEMAERARVSVRTLKRMEQGSPSSSLGAWLAVLERLDLLSLVSSMNDPAAEALLDDTRVKRARRKLSSGSLDF